MDINYSERDRIFYQKVFASMNEIYKSNLSKREKERAFLVIDDIVMNYEEHKSLTQKMILSNFEKRTSEEDRTYN